MNIYPAIDLKSGECVRLYQGCYDKVTVYEKNPVALAREYEKQGTRFLHVVDLDGAKEGKSINLDLIEKIKQATHLQIQTGGGIRTKQQIKEILSKGVTRVVLGTIAIENPSLVKRWLQEFGPDQIVLALDIRMNEKREPKLALHGWQKDSEKNLWQLLDDYKNSNLRHVLCTDIECDGTLQGPNILLYKECVMRYPAIHFQASGGISSLNDLRELARVPLAGAIVGKALYEKKFSLKMALDEVFVC